MAEQQQQLQQLTQQLQAIQAQLQELTTEQEALRATRDELEGAVDALKRLESGATVQVPLGAETYVRAEIDDIDEVLVAIGADYSAERDREGAIETLTERHELVGDRLESLSEHISELQSRGSELEQQAQQLAQRQQMGGAGPMPDRD